MRRSPVLTLALTLAALLAGCADTGDSMDNPVAEYPALIRSADTIVWAEAEATQDGSWELRVDDVLAGGEPTGTVVVDPGRFATRLPSGPAVFVLSGASPPEVLVDPSSGLLTPGRVQRVLDGAELVSPARTVTQIEAALPDADTVVVASFVPDATGRSATIDAVDSVIAGDAPDTGDVIEVPTEAAWDLTAERGRGHLVLRSTGEGTWVVLLEPFGPGRTAEVDWDLVGG